MENDRLRIVVDDPYVHAIGLAMFCFASLEWNAVWCCERIEPGYIHIARGKTAGQIAKRLTQMAANHQDPSIAQSLSVAAAEFQRLVFERNALMHANPATASNGDQRLFREGGEWTIERVNDLADQFVAASLPLNHHLNHVLVELPTDHV